MIYSLDEKPKTQVLHQSFQATRKYMLPLAALHPMTVGTKNNFRIQAVKAAMEDLDIPKDQWGFISKVYVAWREEEMLKSMREHGEEIEEQFIPPYSSDSAPFC